MNKIKPITGAHAVVEAMRQINPDVVAAYPITPQTPIIEGFSQVVADGLVDTELIRIESEHSAMSAVVGASAAGARAMTASASVGVALMWEVLGVASGLRLPIIMAVANRAISGPINIHCDHSDSMGCRDQGWIQLYSEDAQEAYENTLLALKLSEKVLLPTMIMQDGFVTSHCVQKVKIYNDKIIKKFIGEYKPKNALLNTDKPITYGPLELQNYLFETKRQLEDAMQKTKKVYLEVGKELSKITGNKYNYFEEYKTKDADAVIVALNATCGTIKEVVDEMRKESKKVGLLKIRLFRPFCYKECFNALKKIKKISVLDRSESYGANAPIYSEIKNTMFDLKPKLQSCIYGIGGREIFKTDIRKIFENMLKGKMPERTYVGLRNG